MLLLFHNSIVMKVKDHSPSRVSCRESVSVPNRQKHDFMSCPQAIIEEDLLVPWKGQLPTTPRET